MSGLMIAVYIIIAIMWLVFLNAAWASKQYEKAGYHYGEASRALEANDWEGFDHHKAIGRKHYERADRFDLVNKVTDWWERRRA